MVIRISFLTCQASLLALLLGLPVIAFALSPEFPTPAQVTAEDINDQSSFRLPTGPWANGSPQFKRIEGAVKTSAYRLNAPDLTTLEILTPLRDQAIAAGYQVIFECETKGCGGFDFRFESNVMPEPEMHVDLGDFRYLSAENAQSGALGIMVSRSANSGFVQITSVTASNPKPADVVAPASNAAPIANQPASLTLSTATDQMFVAPDPSDLLASGSMVLDGLQFATGSADLTEGRYASLAALAAWLKANPTKTVALVGHTDASGSLDANVALSRRRAQSVRDRLIRSYSIPATQIEAQGVGYLSPKASNLTEDGRAANRRVEAIVTSTQ